MFGDIDVNDWAAVMHQHDKDEQDSTDDGRYGKEIDRHERGDVIRQKGAQVCDGGRRGLRKSRETVRSDTSTPSLPNRRGSAAFRNSAESAA